MAQAPVVRTRLWDAEVKQADSSPEDKTAYVFSNGRRFVETGSRPVPNNEPINAPINE